MKVLLSFSSAETNVKNSRFIAELYPVQSQAEARDKLREVKEKYKDATHVVHAFIAGLKGETSGLSDDGEPSGTAGRPVFEVLKGSGITNVLLTVTRYFGGTLLGTGGLVRAYSDAAKLVLADASAEEYIERSVFSFCTDYSTYETIKRNFAHYHISDVEESFDSSVKVDGKIWTSEKDEFAVEITNITKGKSKVEFC